MIELYWGLFIAGLILTFVMIVFGELLGGILDGILEFLSIDGPGFFHPLTVIGGMTAFGGIGVMLHEYTSWGNLVVWIVNLAITLSLCMLLHFFYVLPLKNSENSTSYSIEELVGRIGEATITIPAEGYGEATLRVGAGRSNFVAQSFDGVEIQDGARVIVIDVEEGVLRVSAFDQEMDHS